MGAKLESGEYFRSEVSSIFSINFYTKSSDFCQVFIDFLSAKVLFQICNGVRSKTPQNKEGKKQQLFIFRKGTAIYFLPLSIFCHLSIFLVLSAAAMSRGISSFLKATVWRQGRNVDLMPSPQQLPDSDSTFLVSRMMDSEMLPCFLQISDKTPHSSWVMVLEPGKKPLAL